MTYRSYLFLNSIALASCSVGLAANLFNAAKLGLGWMNGLALPIMVFGIGSLLYVRWKLAPTIYPRDDYRKW